MFEYYITIFGPAPSCQMAKINYNVSFTNKEKTNVFSQ